MKQFVLFLLASICLSSCGSQKSAAIKDTTQTPPSAATVQTAPAMQKRVPFSIYISGSGTAIKRSDTFKLDTDMMMSVGTARKGEDGKWKPLDALAYLEKVDYDTLSDLIYTNGLFKLEQSDLNSNCVGSEMFMLSIRPIDSSANVRVQFSDCTLDYNLLLEPQRTGLRKLIEWFERMRPKYRPREPE